MKACGISLYRAAATDDSRGYGSVIIMCLEGVSSRPIGARRNQQRIRGSLQRRPISIGVWVTRFNGDVYQYLYFEYGHERLNSATIYQFARIVDARARKFFPPRRSTATRSQGPGHMGGRKRDGSAMSTEATVQIVTSSDSRGGPGYFAGERPRTVHLKPALSEMHVIGGRLQRGA